MTVTNVNTLGSNLSISIGKCNKIQFFFLFLLKKKIGISHDSNLFISININPIFSTSETVFIVNTHTEPLLTKEIINTHPKYNKFL